MLNGPALPTQAILSCRRCLTPLFVTRFVMLQWTQDPAATTVGTWKSAAASHCLLSVCQERILTIPETLGLPGIFFWDFSCEQVASRGQMTSTRARQGSMSVPLITANQYECSGSSQCEESGIQC